MDGPLELTQIQGNHNYELLVIITMPKSTNIGLGANDDII